MNILVSKGRREEELGTELNPSDQTHTLLFSRRKVLSLCCLRPCASTLIFILFHLSLYFSLDRSSCCTWRFTHSCATVLFHPSLSQPYNKSQRRRVSSVYCQSYIVLTIISAWWLWFYSRIIQFGNNGRFTCLHTGQMTVRKHMCCNFFTCRLFLVTVILKLS